MKNENISSSYCPHGRLISRVVLCASLFHGIMLTTGCRFTHARILLLFFFLFTLNFITITYFFILWISQALMKKNQKKNHLLLLPFVFLHQLYNYAMQQQYRRRVLQDKAQVYYTAPV